ncbi:ATP-grasp domain-containing protein [Streptomyces sp. SL13]|uniref:ATP-grasp domain-containing protein n=1 Tax=Streptantibioticus silvisoli TaxID=2705255 RepID=A0AA90JYB4_9ACTN|nr:ATP-grasp domain-containing protein [Streptantibioticus silvisoli]MDI5971051.1 ATP-grasp domain-containing protein [Streptantibioticus silvisoli]
MPGTGDACVVIGCGLGMISEIDKMLPPGSVTVVEEADLIEAGGLRERAARWPCVAAVVEGPAQRQEAAEPPPLAALADAAAVIPSTEYGVVATAVYARAAGLPGAGVAAALALRDKARLREVAGAAGIAQPDWARVADPAAVRAFAARHGGHCVLKPADRQGSLGVRLLGPGDDVDAAWRATAAADDGAARSAGWTPGGLLAEQRLLGPEVSVEALVAEGEVIWSNVTDKALWPGPFPVEAGHTLPSALPPEVCDRVVAATRALIAAVGYGTGALHSEWILVGGTEPHLVECAGRLPGGAIVPLIDQAYGGSLVADLVRVLRGERPDRAARAGCGAAIRFGAAEPGVVRAVHGTQEAAAVEGVFAAVVTAKKGSVAGPVTSGFDRTVHILATGADGPQAAAAAEKAAALVRIETVPADA